MSIEIMTRVWNQSQQQGTKLVLLLALADMANSNGYCWPSLETLQQRARLSHRQNVIKAIAEMEADAEVWVEHSRGRNHSNSYIITVGMGADELSKTLIGHFDYSPADAMQKANAFVKRSPQVENVVGELHLDNVVGELHYSQQNVVVERENVVRTRVKCSPQTTRSVIEPSRTNDDDTRASTPSQSQSEQNSRRRQEAFSRKENPQTPVQEKRTVPTKEQERGEKEPQPRRPNLPPPPPAPPPRPAPDPEYLRIKAKLAEVRFGYSEVRLKELWDKYDHAWFDHAIDVCADADAKRLRYLEGILSRWVVEGFGGRKSQARLSVAASPPPAVLDFDAIFGVSHDARSH